MAQLLALLFLGSLSACASPYPVRLHYVTNVTNQVCSEYEIVDQKAIQFRFLRDLPLEPKGPCDRAFGVSRHDTNTLLNWIRKEIANHAQAPLVEGGALETDTDNPALDRIEQDLRPL